MNLHTEVVERFIVAAHVRCKCRLSKRVAGQMITLSGTVVTPTIPGQYDITGWVVRDGVALHVEIEVKVGADQLKPDQKKWRDICTAHGVLNHVLHVTRRDKMEDSIEAAVRWLAGE